MDNAIDKDVELYVKWFSAVKGYGFGVNEQYKSDVFIHFSLVQALGVSELKTGDKIICDVIQNGNKYQVSNLKKVIPGDGDDTILSKLMNVSSVNATIKWFNVAKGYGFAATKEDVDIFLHNNVVKQKENADNIKITLMPGDSVTLEVVSSSHGLEAVKLVSWKGSNSTPYTCEN